MYKHYACSDLHGMWSLWEQISNYCDETDIIYFLGDAIDRGEDGLKIMESLLKDKRVKYLLGNHEEFFLDSAPLLVGKEEDELVLLEDELLSLWLYNGGGNTIIDFIHKPIVEQKWLISRVKELEDLNIYVNKYNQNIYLCHAGTSLDYTKYDLMLLGKKNPYTWDRHHCHRAWRKGFENCYIVHGHTPVSYLYKKCIIQEYGRMEKDKFHMAIVNYADGHKFDLDLASYTSKEAALFDLDELKVEKYFEMEN